METTTATAKRLTQQLDISPSSLKQLKSTVSGMSTESLSSTISNLKTLNQAEFHQVVKKTTQAVCDVLDLCQRVETHQRDKERGRAAKGQILQLTRVLRARAVFLVQALRGKLEGRYIITLTTPNPNNLNPTITLDLCRSGLTTLLWPASGKVALATEKPAAVARTHTTTTSTNMSTDISIKPRH